MSHSRIRLPLLGAALIACLGAGTAIGLALSGGERAPEPVVREALAQTTHPRGAKGKTLALTRIVVRPGAKLALHHHPGTQIAHIERGVLTYTVERGKTVIKEGPADEGPKVVRKLRAGDTARIKPGQWVVEQPSSHHHAANRGDERIVLYLATLFRRGAPPSLPG
jgi:quercetin dioxygenase-like cupin family protein